jgi:hypothetical protein
MVVGMLALAGAAWATGGGGGGAPTVVRSVPPNGATDVPLDANIKVKFSEAMKDRSINTNTFDFYDCVACTEEPFTIRYNSSTRTAILDPTEPMNPNEMYFVFVEGTGDGDKKAVKDRGGTPLATDYTFTFTTEDVLPCPGC